MQIVIIAGGDGTRMQPLVTHKSLWPFRGIPLLEYELQDLAVLGAKKMIIVASPQTEPEIIKIASKYKAEVIVQRDPLGMADAVISTKALLDLDESILVTDGCTLSDSSGVVAMETAIAKDPKTILLPGQKIDKYRPGGYFKFDQDRITAVIEKPDPDKIPSPYFKLVLDYFPSARSLIEAMEKGQSDADDHYEVALSQLIKEAGAKMVEIPGYHSSLKHAPRVLDVMENVLTHRLVPGVSPSATIASTAVVNGDVEIADNVRIFDHATINGPAYIGKNVIVGNGALVRSSCIEEGCEVGYNSEIARSYLGPNTKCHTSYVGDSVIEGYSNLAAGTITANLRFDNQNVKVNLPSGKIDTGRRKFGAILARGVKTGIHSSLMPGTVLAKDTIYTNQVLGGKDEK